MFPEPLVLRDRYGTVIGDGVSVPEPETPRRKVVAAPCAKHRKCRDEVRALEHVRPADFRRQWAELAHTVFGECKACQALFMEAREKQELSVPQPEI